MFKGFIAYISGKNIPVNVLQFLASYVENNFR